ncbi:alpha/beta fold hydrolase [Streptomyces sp. NPDC088762]|uniref:alpha/beta fold hydrolase n=1 Tax=Streptomyces sp. NPDC088762 TaxID=3365891 RepID=UPI0038184E0B
MASLLRTTLDVSARLAPGLAGAPAFALFVRPLGRPRLRPEEAEVMAQARTGRMLVRGIPVTTYRWGDGERPVLLVHGWSSRASRFAGFVEALRAEGRTVVAFDAPGHGESGGRASTVRDYREIISRLHAEYGDFSTVLAHSVGVLAGLFSLRDGVRADRVIGIGGIAEFGYLLDQFRARLGVGEAVERVLRSHIERRVFPGEADIWQRLDATRGPADRQMPILLIHDVDDDVADPAQSRAIAAAHGSRARLIETSGLGHRRILADRRVIAEAVEFAVSPPPPPSPESSESSESSATSPSSRPSDARASAVAR